MAEQTDFEKTEKLKKFIEETSADDNVANYYLQSKNWNLEAAVAGFEMMKLAEERRIDSRVSNPINDSRPAANGSKRAGPLRRGISMANAELVANAREKIMGSELSNRLDTSFVLPNITTVKEPSLIDFLKSDLIDKATYQSLTKAEVLNWWAGTKISVCRKLFPMSTVGDGNCLLHAVSLAMFGFHDRLLTLRKALHNSLVVESTNGALKRRWMYQQWKLNMEAGSLSFTHEEWEDEWAAMVRLASDKPRNQKQYAPSSRKISRQYSIAITTHRDNSLKQTESQGSDSFESLEEFHVFALAHVLRRPIIVVSDVMLRDLQGEPLQPINFGGIYLPIECEPSICCKYPIVLGYDSSHFAALVPAEGEDVATNRTTLLSNIPISRSSFELLPLHFITDPGTDWTKIRDDSKKKSLRELSKQDKLATLSRYLHVTKVDCSQKVLPMISSLQKNNITEYELDASDLGTLYRKSSKENKPFVTKAFENITTLVTGHSNPTKNSPRVQRKNSGQMLYTAKLNIANKPEYFDEMIENYIASAKGKVHQSPKDSKQQPTTRLQCATSGCTFFGSSDTNYLCSKCYKHQQNASKVYKSMPSLQDDRPLLLAMAKRQLSNPEKVEPEVSLIDFNEGLPSKPFRPATAPPYNMETKEVPMASSENFDLMLDSVLFSQNRQSKPTAPFPSIDEQCSQSKALPISELTPHTLAHAPLSEFDPLKTGLTVQLAKMPFEVDHRFCRGAGCKVFGAAAYGGFCYSCYHRLYSQI